VRRAFASTSSAPAYSYDPYGNALQGTAPVTDFNYAGMFVEPDSGLSLTLYRAYDPLAGRWISRDPMGETGDPAFNLYAYAGGNPILYIDPYGLSLFGSLSCALGGYGPEFAALIMACHPPTLPSLSRLAPSTAWLSL